MAKGKKALDIVKIDNDKLRNAIITKYSLGQMAKIIGKGENYFAPSSGRQKYGISYEELNRICLVIGRDVSDFIIVEPELADEPEPETKVKTKEEAPKQEKPVSDVGIKMLNSIYEGIEMNGAGIGKLLSAIEDNTAAIKELTEQTKKQGVTLTSWAQKWINHKKYGRL